MEEHVKDIISRPHLRDEGVETLNQMQLICATLLSLYLNQYHENFTNLAISHQDVSRVSFTASIR
jgi:hypothetical protein